jgi:hypothetical protein
MACRPFLTMVRMRTRRTRWVTRARRSRVAGSGIQTAGKRPAVRTLARNSAASARLAEAEFGTLRRAKLAAWYLADEPGWQNTDVRDGYTREDYRERLVDAIDDIDPGLPTLLLEGLGPEWRDDQSLRELLLDLYYLRSARAFEWGKHLKT